MQDRTTYLGGSDAAKVVQVAPPRWGSPMTVWAEKVGLADADGGGRPPSMRMFVGTRLEPLVLEMTNARTGLAMKRDQRLRRHPRHTFLGGHFDGIGRDDQGRRVGFEGKTTRSAEGWGEDGTIVTPDDHSGIPLHYLVQVQHYLAISSVDYFVVGVLIAYEDFRTYTVERVPSLIDPLVEAEVEFWQQYVVPRVAPPIDDSDATAAYLKSRYPIDSGEVRAATPEEDAIIASLVQAKVDAADAGRVVTLYESQLKSAIGDARSLVGTRTRATWATITRKPEVAWEAIANAYRTMLDDYQHGRYGATNDGVDLDVIVSLHTGQPTTYRRLTTSEVSE